MSNQKKNVFLEWGLLDIFKVPLIYRKHKFFLENFNFIEKFSIKVFEKKNWIKRFWRKLIKSSNLLENFLWILIRLLYFSYISIKRLFICFSCVLQSSVLQLYWCQNHAFFLYLYFSIYAIQRDQLVFCSCFLSVLINCTVVFKTNFFLRDIGTDGEHYDGYMHEPREWYIACV